LLLHKLLKPVFVLIRGSPFKSRQNQSTKLRESVPDLQFRKLLTAASLYSINSAENQNSFQGETIMGEKRRRNSLPGPSRLIGRATEAAGDAGDLGAELLSTGVDAATSVISRLTSSPEEPMKAPRRHAKQASGAAGVARRTGVTVKRAAEVAAQQNRKIARAEGSAVKKVAKAARKTGRKVAKASKPRKATKARKK
jgi:hypothetical protein